MIFSLLRSIQVKNQPLTFHRLKWKLLHKNSFTFLPKYNQLFADLLHCTNEPNVSIPTLANLLIERTQNPSWVVVYKALITTHHLMCYGNEVAISVCKTFKFTFMFCFAEVHPVSGFKQQQLSAQWLPGQDWSSGWVAVTTVDLNKKRERGVRLMVANG